MAASWKRRNQRRANQSWTSGNSNLERFIGIAIFLTSKIFHAGAVLSNNPTSLSEKKQSEQVGITRVDNETSWLIVFLQPIHRTCAQETRRAVHIPLCQSWDTLSHWLQHKEYGLPAEVLKSENVCVCSNLRKSRQGSIASWNWVPKKVRISRCGAYC